MPILSAIFVTIEMVKFKKMSKFYTSVIFLINQSKEFCEKQFSVFGSKGGQISQLMHVPLYTSFTYLRKKTFLVILWFCANNCCQRFSFNTIRQFHSALLEIVFMKHFASNNMHIPNGR